MNNIAATTVHKFTIIRKNTEQISHIKKDSIAAWMFKHITSSLAASTYNLYIK